VWILDGQRRTIGYELISRRHGDLRQVPSISFSFFDPGTSSGTEPGYRTLTTGPTPIHTRRLTALERPVPHSLAD